MLTVDDDALGGATLCVGHISKGRGGIKATTLCNFGAKVGALNVENFMELILKEGPPSAHNTFQISKQSLPEAMSGLSGLWGIFFGRPRMKLFIGQPWDWVSLS